MPQKVYRAAEVCEAAGLQPYVLRSWEKEFPQIGIQKSPDGPRLYRQSDLDQVLRIKQLVFGEGLTIGGARRRLGATPPVVSTDAEMAEVLETLGADARVRIAAVRSNLRSLLDVLSKAPGTVEMTASSVVAAEAPRRSAAAARKPTGRSNAPAARRAKAKRAPARRTV